MRFLRAAHNFKIPSRLLPDLSKVIDLREKENIFQIYDILNAKPD